jgi:hypothetical protein
MEQVREILQLIDRRRLDDIIMASNFVLRRVQPCKERAHPGFEFWGTLMGCVKSPRTSTGKKRSNGSLHCSTWSDVAGSKIHNAHLLWGIFLLGYGLPFSFFNYSLYSFCHAHFVFQDSGAGPSCILLVGSIKGLTSWSGCLAEQSPVPSKPKSQRG